MARIRIAWAAVVAVAASALVLVSCAASPTLDIAFAGGLTHPRFVLTHGDPGALACGRESPWESRGAFAHNRAAADWRVGLQSEITLVTDDFETLRDPHSVWLGMEALTAHVTATDFPAKIDLIAYVILSYEGTIVGVAEVPVDGYTGGPEYPAIAPLECMGGGVAVPEDIGDDLLYTLSLVVQAVDSETGRPWVTYFNPGHLGPRGLTFAGGDAWWERAWASDAAPMLMWWASGRPGDRPVV